MGCPEALVLDNSRQAGDLFVWVRITVLWVRPDFFQGKKLLVFATNFHNPSRS